MKATGIIRRIDEIGRVVIPMEIRKNLGIREGDPLEISVDNDSIVLTIYTPEGCCIFCGREKSGLKMNDRFLCHQCLCKLNEGETDA